MRLAVESSPRREPSLPWSLPSVDLPPPLHPPWRPSGRHVPTPLADLPSGARGVTLGWFASVLRSAEVLDSSGVGLAGGQVVFPYGVRLLRRFESIVRTRFEAAGLEEWEYPLLAPPATYEPARRLLDLHDALLHVGNDADWEAGVPRATLCPTGESVVYTHWARILRSDRDLPLRMYRRARFFRPTRRGDHAALFRPMEAGDVFEFHEAYAGAVDKQVALERALTMVQGIARALAVPVLWSMRPRWGNHAAVAEHIIGGDTPLPSRATLQVGCLYDQATRFSDAYGIGFGRDRSDPTHHVAGAVTRRLLLSALFQASDVEGNLLVHPAVAPAAGVVMLQQEASDDGLGSFAAAVASRLATSTLTVRRSDVGKALRRARRQGWPAVVLIQPPRHALDSRRVLVVGGDHAFETALLDPTVEEVVVRTEEAARATGHEVARRIARLVSDSLVETTDPRSVLADRLVAVTPMQPNEDATKEVASWHGGEVLGFVRSDTEAACSVTGAPTSYLGLLSPRL